RLEDARAQRREQAVRGAGPGTAELLPADGRARPVAAPGEVVTHELLVGHGGAGHGVAAAVVRQPGAGGHPGTGEHRDGSAPQQVERRGDLLRGAAMAVVRSLHRSPGRQSWAAAGGSGAVRCAGSGGEPAADVRRRAGATGRGGRRRSRAHLSRVGGGGPAGGTERSALRVSSRRARNPTAARTPSTATLPAYRRTKLSSASPPACPKA